MECAPGAVGDGGGSGVVAGACDVEGVGAGPVEAQGGLRGGFERGELAEVDAVPMVFEDELRVWMVVRVAAVEEGAVVAAGELERRVGRDAVRRGPAMKMPSIVVPPSAARTSSGVDQRKMFWTIF